MTYDPARLSAKTRLTKSSIEYIILSRISEHSGSVASCLSFPDISVSAAVKNICFSETRISLEVE